jgi:hypothetical protein
MTPRRDYIDQIEEIRERTGHPDWDNGLTKLFFLSQYVQKLAVETEEANYYPVAAIAAVESYFRWEIRRLVDSGDPRFVNNLRFDKLQLKLDHEVLFAVHGKRVTIGELVARSVRLSSLDAINETMHHLLACDFVELVKDARHPEERRKHGDNAARVIDPAETFRVLKRAFEVRNIVCHEAHLWSSTTLSEIKEICSECCKFAIASHYAVMFHRNPQSPLTLEESFRAVSERVRLLENEIMAIENELTLTMPPPVQETFRGMQEAWRKFVEKQGWFYASQQMNGNRGALHEKFVAEELGKERLAVLNAMKKANIPILGPNEARPK